MKSTFAMHYGRRITGRLSNRLRRLAEQVKLAERIAGDNPGLRKRAMDVASRLRTRVLECFDCFTEAAIETVDAHNETFTA